LWPVAISDVEIGMADATGFNCYQNFAGTRLRARNIYDCERLLEFLQDGSFHAVTVNRAEWEMVFMMRAI